MSKEKPYKCWTSKAVGGPREEVLESRGVSPTLFRVLWAHLIELRRPHALYAEMRLSWMHVITLTEQFATFPSLNLVLGFALNDRELAQTRSWDKSGKSIHLKGHLHISSLLNIEERQLEEDHLKYGADENHLEFLRWPALIECRVCPDLRHPCRAAACTAQEAFSLLLAWLQTLDGIIASAFSINVTLSSKHWSVHVTSPQQDRAFILLLVSTFIFVLQQEIWGSDEYWSDSQSQTSLSYKSRSSGFTSSSCL